MKVLILQPFSGVGGVERLLEFLLEGLAGRVEARVIMPAGGELTRRIEALGVPVDSCELRPTPFRSPIRIAAAYGDLARVARVAREFRPDVVHQHCGQRLIYSQVASQASGARALMISHGETDLDRWTQRLLVRLTMSRVLTVSQQMCDRYSRQSPWLASRTFRLHPGIDCSTFDVAADSAGCKEARGLGRQDFVVSIVGRLAPEKNHLMFLDAAERLAGQFSNARFLILGDLSGGTVDETEEYKAQLTARVSRSALLRERVVLAGFTADVRPWLHATDVLVCASHSESFGLSLLEAMACGLPVVSTDCGGPREIVVEGETGFLVPVGDTAALTARLGELQADPIRRRVMGEAGRKRAARLFGRDRFASEVLAHYEAIASQR